MQRTLLDMTQNILSSMDSAEVNSISDTTESSQVAEIIRTKYFDIIARANLPEHQQLFSLTGSGDGDLPVIMYRPDNVSRVDWIQYDTTASGDTSPEYTYVTIVPLTQFLTLTNFNPDDTDVDSYTVEGQTFLFRNSCPPQYCTIIKNYYVLFDSYDNTVDTTLQSSKSKCFGLIIPTFTMSDSFIPDLDDSQFPLLLSEAKATAFLELKQTVNNSAVQEARRQWSNLSGSKYLNRESDFNQLPNFGWR